LAIHGGGQSTAFPTCFTARKESLVPPEQEDRWTSQLIWISRRQKYLAYAENQIKILSSQCPSQCTLAYECTEWKTKKLTYIVYF
jgi:hypothetical protein